MTDPVEPRSLPLAALPDYEAWKDWAESEFGRFSNEQRCYYDTEVFARWPAGSGKRLLELGFGNGSFLGCARDAGYEASGVELNRALRERALKAGFEVFDDASALPDGVFDGAVAFDVLEHIPGSEGVAFLRHVARSVKPGGLIVLRFPNGDSPFGRVHQHGDVTHVSAVGSGKLRYFAVAAGLVVVELANEHIPTKHLPLRRRVRRELRKLGSKWIETALGITFYDGRRPLAQNLVAVLRKPGATDGA